MPWVDTVRGSVVNTAVANSVRTKCSSGVSPVDQEREPVRSDLNAESLEAIREGDSFLESGKEGRFINGADLIAAAMA